MSARSRKAITHVRHGQALDARGHWLRAALTSGPAVFWMLIFLLGPLLLVCAISFFSRGAYGEIELPLTFDSYKRLLGFGTFGYDPVYIRIFLRSVALGLSTTVLCILSGLPLAFFIGRLSPRFKTGALLLVIIPFWTNLLIRTYAWQLLLSPESPITKAAQLIGLCPAGEALYPGALAVQLAMVCDFLPFMVLPLFASVEKVDWAIWEAAKDLGAGRIQAFRHGLLPQILPGLWAGAALVFLPATGQFVIPDLLGGGKTVLLGNAIQQQFGQSRNWPLGSTIAFVALVLVVAGLWLAKPNPEEEGASRL